MKAILNEESFFRMNERQSFYNYESQYQKIKQSKSKSKAKYVINQQKFALIYKKNSQKQKISMDLNSKHNRIFRMIPRDLSMQRNKQVFQRNYSLFLRVNKNTAVLTKPNTSLNVLYDQQNNQNIQNSIPFFQQENQINQSKASSVLGLNRKNSGQFALNLSKQKSLNQILPQIANTSSGQQKNKKKMFVKSQYQIAGTILGALSSGQILQKYKKKKIKQELTSKRYLQQHIKKLKLIEVYDQDQEPSHHQRQIPVNSEQKCFNMITATANTSRSMSISLSLSKQMNKIRVSQQKLLKLLDNKLSDKDYNQYNKKLFEKKDVSKRRFFKRYHNILKRQRQQEEAYESKQLKKNISKQKL